MEADRSTDLLASARLLSMTAAFPNQRVGRLPRLCFRGLLGVHSRYGLPARGPPKSGLSIEGFDSFVQGNRI